jgi:hypothetical protein
MTTVTETTLGPVERCGACSLRGPFRARFAVKMALLLVSIVPFVLLPWPSKIVIDHVIEGV